MNSRHRQPETGLACQQRYPGIATCLPALQHSPARCPCALALLDESLRRLGRTKLRDILWIDPRAAELSHAISPPASRPACRPCDRRATASIRPCDKATSPSRCTKPAAPGVDRDRTTRVTGVARW